MTKAEAVKAFLDQCYSDLGYHETGDNVNKFAEFLDAVPNFYNGPKNGYAWCDVYVDAELALTFGYDLARQMLYQPERSAGAGCIYSRGYYEQNGAYYKTPELGDQAFFGSHGSEYHTGVVYAVNGNRVKVIEGNSGDKVQLLEYRIGDGTISGYGRPNWSLVADLILETTETEEPSEEPSESILEEDGTFCQVALPVLSEGSVGHSVAILQFALNERGYTPSGSKLTRGGWDGDFGAGTYRALVNFQAASGVSPCEQGSTGPETWAFLINDF